MPDPPDLGAADPRLQDALASYDRDECGDDVVLAALAAARLIVPVTAVPGAEQAVDMALPVMVGTDGRRALPVFTSVAALAAWDESARPVPVDSRRAAAGALQEGCDFLVLDPAGPVTWVADLGQVQAIAAGL